MSEQPTRSTYIRETQKSSGSATAFIVGGLVVAVAVIAWLIYGGIVPVSTTGADGSTTNVTIEAAPEAAAPAAEAPAPAPEAAAPAPAGN